MFEMLLSFVSSFRVYFQSRADLQTEILALRHQIVVLQRAVPNVQLLATIRSIFNQQKTDRISSEAIVHALADGEDRPWPDRLPLTKAQLARRLAPFGIRPTIVHRSRIRLSRGYRLKDFHDAFARYLPQE
jgi:hypothetical protein